MLRTARILQIHPQTRRGWGLSSHCPTLTDYSMACTFFLLYPTCPVTDHDSKLINVPLQALRHCRGTCFAHLTSKLFFCFFLLCLAPKQLKRIHLSACCLSWSSNLYDQEPHMILSCYPPFQNQMLPTAITISNTLFKKTKTNQQQKKNQTKARINSWPYDCSTL